MRKIKYFARIRPTLVDGTMYIWAEVRKKEGGMFEKLGYWRTPPMGKAICSQIIVEPEWTVGKRKYM